MNLEYGIIGNCRSVALVSEDASIDWLCLPRFDSPSIFAKILDERKGGEFYIRPTGRYEVRQEYIRDTNVLKTTMKSAKGTFDIIDYFPHYVSDGGLLKESEIHRLIRVTAGRPEVVVGLHPKFEYASDTVKPSVAEGYATFLHGTDNLYVYTDLGIDNVISGKKIRLKGDSYVLLSYNKLKEKFSLAALNQELDRTVNYWRQWIGEAKLPNRHRYTVARSALTLRLLTYDDSGAIVAAATTSIPEVVGDVRNWDYRYCWLRDASFTVLSLIKLLKFDVAYEFVNWLTGIYTNYGVNFQVLFGVNGERKLDEKTLPYLSGYKNSKPVRIGNAAYKQKQLDIFGDTLDALYLFYIEHNVAKMTDNVQWELIYSMVESAIAEWKEKDSSIWELRTKKRHYTFSKVLCWTAVDRGLKIARHFGKRSVIRRWTKEANAIRRDVMEKGWNAELRSFTQSYDSTEMDASLLLLPYFGFVEYKDPKMRGTVEAIRKELFDGDFVMRYRCEDDFGKPKNAFIPCTFWLIDAMNGIGEHDEARRLFERTVAHANHLGLLSEVIESGSGELLGNFPQAYSHIALINSATDLFS